MPTRDAIARRLVRSVCATGAFVVACLGTAVSVRAATPPQTDREAIRFDVAVPAVGQPFVAQPHTVSIGDHVVFVVTSTRAGHVSVHGLSGDVPVGPGTTARVDVTVRTIGRFPLHFHGDDGAHIALSGLDVYPKD